MEPNGAVGKQFMDEISKLLNIWTNGTPLKNIALKAIHLMPALLLQKLSKASKAKDHLKALEERRTTPSMLKSRNRIRFSHSCNI